MIQMYPKMSQTNIRTFLGMTGDGVKLPTGWPFDLLNEDRLKDRCQIGEQNGLLCETTAGYQQLVLIVGGGCGGSHVKTDINLRQTYVVTDITPAVFLVLAIGHCQSCWIIVLVQSSSLCPMLCFLDLCWERKSWQRTFSNMVVACTLQVLQRRLKYLRIFQTWHLPNKHVSSPVRTWFTQRPGARCSYRTGCGWIGEAEEVWFGMAEISRATLCSQPFQQVLTVCAGIQGYVL